MSVWKKRIQGFLGAFYMPIFMLSIAGGITLIMWAIVEFSNKGGVPALIQFIMKQFFNVGI